MDFKLPEKYNPKPDQIEGIKHILQVPGCGLFLKPGRGKTSTTLAGFKILKKQNLVRAALIVAPMRVVKYTWPAEVAKWTDFEDFSVVILHGPKKDEAFKKKADIYLINFEGLLWLLPKLAKLHKDKWPFDMLVVDESTKLKAYDSKRFKALKKELPKFKRRVILTGTPTPQGKEDLFAQVYIMDCGKALTPFITHFRNTYFHIPSYLQKPGEPPPRWGYVLNNGAAELIDKKIEHMVYTSDGLPYAAGQEPIINDVFVELPPEARKQYRTMQKILFAQIKTNTVLAANAAVAAGKCRQIASGSVYVDDDHNYEVVHEAKLEALEDLLDELVGVPVLIWYEFKSDLAILLARFPGEVLTAKSPMDTIDRWNAKKIERLYVHHQSAAHGLNMQYGSHVMIYYTVPWSGEGFYQGIARLARTGQELQVIVHRIIAMNTVDEIVVKTLELANAEQEAFLRSMREYYESRKHEIDDTFDEL